MVIGVSKASVEVGSLVSLELKRPATSCDTSFASKAGDVSAQGGVELQNPFSGRCDSPCLTVFGATIGVLNPKPPAPNPNPRPQTQTLRETPSKMRFPAGRLALSGPSNRTRWSKLMPAPQWVFSFSGFPGLSFKCYRFRFIYKIL